MKGRAHVIVEPVGTDRKAVQPVMNPLTIDCSDKNWKSQLKRRLQDGIEVDNFDYTADGPFCELLALSHSMSFRLAARNQAGRFRKQPPAGC